MKSIVLGSVFLFFSYTGFSQTKYTATVGEYTLYTNSSEVLNQVINQEAKAYNEFSSVFKKLKDFNKDILKTCVVLCQDHVGYELFGKPINDNPLIPAMASKLAEEHQRTTGHANWAMLCTNEDI